MISNANTIINRVDNPNIQWTEVERNAVKAEALFFRAYAYNVLVNLFGGVPIVIEEVAAPKLDFVRASRLEVLQQEQSDLEFAIEWLPTDEKVDGRITKVLLITYCQKYILVLVWSQMMNPFIKKRLKQPPE